LSAKANEGEFIHRPIFSKWFLWYPIH